LRLAAFSGRTAHGPCSKETVHKASNTTLLLIPLASIARRGRGWVPIPACDGSHGATLHIHAHMGKKSKPTTEALPAAEEPFKVSSPASQQSTVASVLLSSAVAGATSPNPPPLASNAILRSDG
jgi:hypothetical protein